MTVTLVDKVLLGRAQCSIANALRILNSVNQLLQRISGLTYEVAIASATVIPGPWEPPITLA